MARGGPPKAVKTRFGGHVESITWAASSGEWSPRRLFQRAASRSTDRQRLQAAPPVIFSSECGFILSILRRAESDMDMIVGT
jgi:hypothetical protein